MFPNFRKGNRPRGGRPARPYRPRLEALEDRLALSQVTPPSALATLTFQPTFVVYQPTANGTPAPPGTALTPNQIRNANCINEIQFAGITGDGTGQTIAIVDAFDDPGLVSSTSPNFVNSDLHKFDVQFGLPDPPSFLKLDQFGGTTYPTTDPTGNWETEEALDVEWAHVIAPKANIILVEANNSTFPNLVQTAVNTARNLPGVSVVSMSFGGPEFAAETTIDPVFTTPPGHQPVTFLASTGDNGAPGGYPAYSPNVVAVGGTTLATDAAGDYLGETGWSGSGGGISRFEAKPAYQFNQPTPSPTQRTIPDVAFDADPASGVAVFNSFSAGPGGPWEQIGGTSLACPCWAGLVAITNQGRALLGLPSLDGPSQTLPRLYTLRASDFHDIVAGNNGFPAGPGYDLVTGRGSPVACDLVPDLSGAVLTAPIPGANLYRPLRYIFDDTAADLETGNLTLTNTSSQTITGPIGILIEGLPPDVTVVNQTGTFEAEPFISVPVVSLPPDSTLRIPIILSNPHHRNVSTFFEGFDIQAFTET